MNKFFGTGNLGSDPVLRSTPSGKSVANFNIAIDRRYWTGQPPNRVLVKEKDWIPVVVWGPLAETCCKFLQKGSKVAIDGPVRPRQYVDQGGTKHNTFEVVASEVEFLSKIRSTNQSVVTDPEAVAI